MSELASSQWGTVTLYAKKERVTPPPKANWPLMGDIVASRGGIPEHLIQWSRASGDEDPDPLL